MINVTNEVRIYEVNGAKLDHPEPPFMIISSHIMSEMVVIKFTNETNSYTVSVRDLQSALQNAQNSNHWG